MRPDTYSEIPSKLAHNLIVRLHIGDNAGYENFGRNDDTIRILCHELAIGTFM